MKKVITLTLAVVFVMSTTSLFAQKFGRINKQELVIAMPEFTEFQKNMDTYGKELQDQIETLQVELNNKAQEYQKNIATMSEAVKNLKEKELSDMSARRDEYSQVAQQDYQKKYGELLDPIVTKANEAIAKVAKASAYTFVFDSAVNPLAYADEAVVVDILPAVKQSLGIKDQPAPAAAAPAKK